MFFAVISFVYLALFFCAVFAEENTDENGSGKSGKILHKNYFTEVKKYSEYTKSVFKNLGTNLTNSVRNVLKAKEQKSKDANSYQIKITLRNKKILGSVFNFFKNTGTFISKAFNSMKLKTFEINRTEESFVSKLSRKKSLKLHTNFTIIKKQSNITDFDVKFKYEHNSNTCEQNSCNLPVIKSSTLLGALYAEHTDSGKAHNSRTKDVVYEKGNILTEPFKSNTALLICDEEKCLKQDQVSNAAVTLRNEHEFRVGTSTETQLKPTEYIVAEETLSKQNHTIRFLSHSEEYQKLWKSVFKMNEEERYSRMAWTNLTKRTVMKNSSEKYLSHSEEYRMKWQPLIEHMYLKPGRRLMPGRSFKWTTDKSVEESSVVLPNIFPGCAENRSRDFNNTRHASKMFHSACKPTALSDELGFGNKEHGFFHDKLKKSTSGRGERWSNSIVSTNGTFTSADIPGIKLIHKSYYFLDKEDKNTSIVEKHVLLSNATTLTTLSDSNASLEIKKKDVPFVKIKRGNKEHRRLEENAFLGLSARQLRPWAESRFQRVSNNIGLDQHFKTIGSRCSRVVSPLTARPNNSRVTFDKMFS